MINHRKERNFHGFFSLPIYNVRTLSFWLLNYYFHILFPFILLLFFYFFSLCRFFHSSGATCGLTHTILNIFFYFFFNFFDIETFSKRPETIREPRKKILFIFFFFLVVHGGKKKRMIFTCVFQGGDPCRNVLRKAFETLLYIVLFNFPSTSYTPCDGSWGGGGTCQTSRTRDFSDGRTRRGEKRAKKKKNK